MIIDGKALAKEKRAEIAKQVEALKEKGVTPGLAVVLVGEDPASQIYVRNKHKACEEVGIYSRKITLPEETTEEEILKIIDELNNDPEIDGILVQLPLPKHIDPDKVILSISPDKDVDGFHPVNAGRLLTGQDGFFPCTPLAVMELIKSAGVDVSGKEAVVVGRSNIVGKPVSMLLLRENATVTICHSRTKNLADVCRRADILVAAVGRPEMITADYVKEGAVVIDVGINRVGEKKVVGDVAFDEVKDKAAYITPVPGGVGPMTITMLLYNTLLSAQKRVSK
ncbi:MAG TPA: bifunctional methylenetetrahydrofolate dehydrogenase/methenyltetrahydrofolate cyclohydrolase FolD [Bacillota bacterium]|nr:bifunctional methylenetetrahydrofolate dehydrogenase/methenyltetrahydrofolate cyclohydrolase FolD [Bacillota bacterium]HOJ46979.1 bifunctional methylenetetrahydrofolate dehydrogenase/methenyltetrahydrofolate cyclohydrolase FolD [Bacillota bacterium]HOL14215.1 bifunctional methylenetetrahydrofolate dehydrogenase/methenyltetrahydrofolate cyclohydrolase FolD [Bacillota bacterium]